MNGRYTSLFRPKESARLRLFCFPYAGGGSSIYAQWRGLLPEDVDVCPVQLPGRENRFSDEPFRELSPLVGEIAIAMQPLLDIPFVIYGHSMGALIGFEVSRKLRETTRLIPQHLIAAACRAPHVPSPRKPMSQLENAEFVASVSSVYGGIPQEILMNEDALEMFLPLIRADIAVFESYRYSDRLPMDCPISVLYGLSDRSTNREDVAQWKLHTTRDFHLYTIPGDHFFIRSHREEILEIIAGVVTGYRLPPASD